MYRSLSALPPGLFLVIKCALPCVGQVNKEDFTAGGGVLRFYKGRHIVCLLQDPSHPSQTDFLSITPLFHHSTQLQHESNYTQ